MKMLLSIISVAAWLTLAAGQHVLAQEADDKASEEKPEDAPVSEEAILDDDVFKPSEIIEADSEISFPADI